MLVAMGLGIGYFLDRAARDLPPAAVTIPVVMTACGVAVTLIIHMRLRDGGSRPASRGSALARC